MQSPAFASVIANLNSITSMVYKGKMLSNGSTVMKLDVFYQAPGLLRIETRPSANGPNTTNDVAPVINILDTTLGKGVSLITQGKMAMPFEFAPDQSASSPEEDPLYWLEAVKQHQGEVVVLDPQEINGVMTTGYQITDLQMTITLWVDAVSELPVRIHIVMDKVNNQIPFEFVADVTFNTKLKSDLFDLQPSAEYRMMEGED
jgi:outer membrane lipoprotein-sorting protein